MPFTRTAGCGEQLLHRTSTESLQRQSTVCQLVMVLDLQVHVQRLSGLGALASDFSLGLFGASETKRGGLCGLRNHVRGMEPALGVRLQREVPAFRQPARTAVDVSVHVACGSC